MGKREAGNPILNILSKSTLAIFSLGEIPFYPLRSTSKTDNEDGTLVKTENPIKFDICEKMFKSSDNLQTHDQKFHIEKRTIKINSINVTNVLLHLQGKANFSSHKKCNICECIFTNITILQTHMKTIHKKQLTKHKTIKSKRYHK